MSGTIGHTVSIFSNYAREIEVYRKEKESQRKPYLFNSPQLCYRFYLVEWMKSVSQKLKLSYRTFHLATYFLDMFMDNHSIIKERLGFLSLVCLMIAAKFEELDAKIPKISEMNKFDGFRYCNREFIKLEVMVLKFLDFDITQPTVAHFVEYYAMVAVIPEDLKTSRFSCRYLGDTADSVITEFMDLSLKEVKFLQHPPSKVAASCVMAARKQMKLYPVWTNILTDVTGYREEHLIYCLNLLMRKLNEEKSRDRWLRSPDHGYISDAS